MLLADYDLTEELSIIKIILQNKGYKYIYFKEYKLLQKIICPFIKEKKSLKVLPSFILVM